MHLVFKRHARQSRFQVSSPGRPRVRVDDFSEVQSDTAANCAYLSLRFTGRRRFDAALEALQRDLGKLRGERASAGLLDQTHVTAAGGAPQPLSAFGTVAVRDAQTLVVNLYDPSTRAAVESAIRSANLGLQPQAAGEGGNVLYIAVPPPSGEQRARLLKLVAAAAESARAAGRRVRQDALDQLRRSSQGGSTDDARRLEKQVQNAADSYTKAVAAVVESKEKAV